MALPQSETEAGVLRDLAHNWVRLANQIDRYTALLKSNGPHGAGRNAGSKAKNRRRLAGLSVLRGHQRFAEVIPLYPFGRKGRGKWTTRPGDLEAQSK